MRIRKLDDVVFEFNELFALFHGHILFSIVDSLTAFLLIWRYLSICSAIFTDVLDLVFTTGSWNSIYITISIFIISWLILADRAFFTIDNIWTFYWKKFSILSSILTALPLLHLLN